MLTFCAKVQAIYKYFFISPEGINPIHDWEGGGQKDPPYQFFPVAISPKKFLNFSFFPFATPNLQSHTYCYS